MIGTPLETTDPASSTISAEAAPNARARIVSATPRRRVLQGLGLLATAPWLARAEPASAASGKAMSAAPIRLPLHLVQLVNHIGTSVPDVTRAATFYSHLFEGGRLFGQTKPALRYEINFHPGALSIGPLRAAAAGAPEHPFIDHFCVVAQPFDGAAWRARLARDGIEHFAGGSFVRVGGVAVQVFGARMPRARRKAPPGGGFNPMPALYTGQPLVRAHGFEGVMLHVSDLEASSARFRELFGLAPHESSPERIVFRLGAIRLGLQRAAPGAMPGIASFAIKVSPFDHGRVGRELEALGAKVEPVERAGRRTILRFADPDGIQSALWTV